MRHIAIVGGRDFIQYELLRQVFLNYIDGVGLALYNITIVSGGAMGADSLGEKLADEFDFAKMIFLPDWKKYGKSAGYRRNISIIEASDVVFAFWNDISKGTAHSIKIAREMNKELYVVKY